MKTSHLITRRRKGFTLIELMVVVVIIAVLVTLGFMGARRAMDSASKAKTIGNLKQLVSAHQLFATENNGAIMDWTGTYVDGVKRGWSQHLLVALSPDLAIDENFRKPIGDSTARGFGIFADPKALKNAKGQLQKTGHNSWRTYAYNNRIGTYTPETPEPIQYKQGAKYTHQVEAGSKLILFSQRILDGSQYFAFLQPEDGQNDKLDFKLYGGSIMVGFYDGHVDMMPKGTYPTAIGVGKNPATGKPYTQTEWREHWWGAKEQIPPLTQ